MDKGRGGVTGPLGCVRDGDQGRMGDDMALLPVSPMVRGRKTEGKAERNEGNFGIFAKYCRVGATDISTYYRNSKSAFRDRGARYADQRGEFFASRVGTKKTKSFCPDSRSKNTKTFFFLNPLHLLGTYKNARHAACRLWPRKIPM